MANWIITVGADHTVVNGLPNSGDNDHGTIRGGGNVGSTDLWSGDAVSLGVNRVKTVVSGVSHIESPLAAGAFNAGDQVLKRVTTDIAGVSNTELRSGGSNSANRSPSIKQKTNVSTFYYKTAVRTGGWHEYSGVFSPAVSVGATGAWSQATDTDVSSELVASGVDNAANPTAAIPGELVYRDGSAAPVQDDYAAKTLF